MPDSRVEKAAYTAKKNGHVIFFAGPQIRNFAFPIKTFEKTYSIPFNRRANLKIPPYWNRLKKGLKKVISECKPDLIHAHNIIAGKLACELNVPFIYDDHEYWSISSKAKKKTKLYHIFSHPYKEWLTKRWEKEILEKASAVITTTETVAEEHKKQNSHVFVVPNFPSLAESKRVKVDMKTKRLSSVYIGNDLSQPYPQPYRDVTGLIKIFKQNNLGTLTVMGDNKLLTNPPVISLGFLPHQKMMKELTKHHIGLLPWRKHWLHKYKDPNKPYEYAHAGLLTLSISDIPSVLNNLKNFVKTFEDYKELIDILTYYSNNLKELLEVKPKIRDYALKNLIWEKNEAKILEAYSRC
ncbi:MAG: glycosyltransferase [Candidatus Heimdallarchaeaceae archaeon]